jgi:Trk K+ transport system NAD-binding subunit
LSDKAPRKQGTRVVVVGLGRFGGALARELVTHGSEVLAIDSNPTLAQQYSDELTHVVLPEHDMGERVAHLVTGRMIDYIEFDTDYAMAKTSAPRTSIGKTLTASGLRQHFDITVVAIKHRGGEFTYATADTVVAAGDVLIVSGRIEEVERFADLT